MRDVGEDRRRETGDGRPKTGDGRLKTEDRRRKTEDGRRKTEDGRPKMDMLTCFQFGEERRVIVISSFHPFFLIGHNEEKTICSKPPFPRRWGISG